MSTVDRSTLFSVGVGLATLFIGSSAHAQCVSDEECKDGRKCISGECQGGEGPQPAPQPPPQPAEPVPVAPASALGEIGESCRARADCREGLRCIEQVCRSADTPVPPPAPEVVAEGPPPAPGLCSINADCGDGLRCENSRCVNPNLSGSYDDFGGGVIGDGTHGFIGGVLMGGPSLGGDYATGGTTVLGTFLFAVKASLLAGNFELGLEFSPMTRYTTDTDGPNLQMNATVGGYIPITDTVFWPMRFGAGFTTVNTGDLVLLQTRLDLLGLALTFDRLLIDLHFPSVRFESDVDVFYIVTWHFGTSIGYIF